MQPDLFANLERTSEFKAFHAKNQHLYEAFCKVTNDAVRNGHTKFSANCAVQFMRWFTPARADGSRYKIPNFVAPYYARLYMAQFKSSVFRTARSKADVEVSCP